MAQRQTKRSTLPDVQNLFVIGVIPTSPCDPNLVWGGRDGWLSRPHAFLRQRQRALPGSNMAEVHKLRAIGITALGAHMGGRELQGGHQAGWSPVWSTNGGKSLNRLFVDPAESGCTHPLEQPAVFPSPAGSHTKRAADTESSRRASGKNTAREKRASGTWR